MVMLRLFHGIRQRFPLTLTVAHVNHQLRGEESEADQKLVESSAAALGLPVIVRRIHPADRSASSSSSLEARARGLRYAALEEIRTEVGATSTATAHQKDDQAETVLLNLFRGSGVRGLAGIPVRRPEGMVIRPLLFARRRDLEAYAAAHGVTYRSDASNACLQHERNLIRHHVLPALAESVAGDPVETLHRLSRTMGSVRDRLDADLAGVLSTIVTEEPTGHSHISVRDFLRLPEYLRSELVLELLRRHGVALSERKVEAVVRLAEGESGHRVDLGRGLCFEHDRDTLRLGMCGGSEEFAQTIRIGEQCETEDFIFSSRVVRAREARPGQDRDRQYVDLERLREPLVLRSWQPGDWFRPLGMSGRKKISDLFTEAKATNAQKSRTPLLTSGGDIVWVCGLRLDERFKLTPATAEAVELTCRFHHRG